MQQKYKNNLALSRKKNALEQKQIARILGQKTVNQISRYERGLEIPNLKNALKLQIIYRLPIHILFYGCYESCLKEIRKQEKKINFKENFAVSKDGDLSDDLEFCTFIEKLKPFQVSESDLNKARNHITELLNTRRKRMNH